MVLQRSGGARTVAGTDPIGGEGGAGGRHPSPAARPISPRAFTGVAVARVTAQAGS